MPQVMHNDLDTKDTAKDETLVALLEMRQADSAYRDKLIGIFKSWPFLSGL
jgi:hypothetical protein